MPKSIPTKPSRHTSRSIVLVVAVLCGLSAQLRGSENPRVVHIFVALADNAHQGIVPVPAVLGNGDDPGHNLYWGAAFGVRTFFRKSADWRETLRIEKPYKGVLERIVFKHRTANVIIVADAYQGAEIRQAVTDFFSAAAGIPVHKGEPAPCAVGSVADCQPENAELVVYVGHDGLMDFSLSQTISSADSLHRKAIILACASKQYFAAPLKSTGAQPILWTTNLMAPEAYTLKAALDGWILNESPEQIRQRAAAAYAQYQKISTTAALRLFSSSW